MIAREVDLVALRGDTLHVLVAVEGVDLTGQTFGFAIGLHADPQGRQVQLGTTTAVGGEGVRLARVFTTPEGVPVSWLEICMGKARFAPPAFGGGEIGADAVLRYDLQASGLGIQDGRHNPETTLMRGRFIMKGSVHD